MDHLIQAFGLNGPNVFILRFDQSPAKHPISLSDGLIFVWWQINSICIPGGGIRRFIVATVRACALFKTLSRVCSDAYNNPVIPNREEEASTYMGCDWWQTRKFGGRW